MDICENNLANKSVSRISSTCETFQTLLATLLSEIESRNYIEVADILRFDLTDLMLSFGNLFPEIASELIKIDSSPCNQE